MTDHAVGEPVGRDQPPAEGGTGGLLPRDVLTGPLYPRLLRLRHLNPTAWQRAILVEGVASVGAILALADVITAWAPMLLPLAVAGVVKFHDALIGILGPRAAVGAAAPDASPELAEAPGGAVAANGSVAANAPAAAAPSGVRVVPSPETSGTSAAKTPVTASAPPSVATSSVASAPPATVPATTSAPPSVVAPLGGPTPLGSAGATPTPVGSGAAVPAIAAPARSARSGAVAGTDTSATAERAAAAEAPVADGDATFRIVPARTDAAPEVAAEPIVSPEVAEDDIDILGDEAREIAAELLRLDGEVGLFALGIDHDGEVVPIDTVEAYDRVPLEVRVAALRQEAVRAAGAGEVRAVAIAVGRGDTLFLDVDHAAAEPIGLEIPLTGRASALRRHGAARYVSAWGDPAD